MVSMIFLVIISAVTGVASQETARLQRTAAAIAAATT